MYKGNCIIYTRCSTEEQKNKGFSHEYQEGSIKQALEGYDNSHCVGVYSDTITGTTLDRPKLMDLYNLCIDNPGHIQFVLVHKWDRFGRNVEECLKWVRLFREAGVEVNCPYECIDFKTTDYSILLSVRFSLGETESRKISERTRDGMNQARREGYYTSTCPVGYKRVVTDVVGSGGKKRKLMVKDDKSGLIRELFLSFISGENRGELYRQYGKRIGIKKNAFYGIFTNPTYAGKVYCKAYKHYPDEVVEGKHEGIITELEYAKVEERLEEDMSGKKGKTYLHSSYVDKAPFYLKGILVCSASGKMMTGTMSKGRSRKYGYYQTPSGKIRSSIKVEIAHEIIDNVISELMVAYNQDDVDFIVDEIKMLQEPKRKIIAQVKKKLHKINLRLDRIKEDYLSGDLDAIIYKEFKQELVQDKIGLEKELLREESYMKQIPDINLSYLNSLVQLPHIYNKANNKLKSKILKSLFPECIEIDAKNRQVRTTRINSLIKLKSYESDSYESIGQEKGANFLISPVMGGRRDSNPRPSVPQTDALTS